MAALAARCLVMRAAGAGVPVRRLATAPASQLAAWVGPELADKLRAVGIEEPTQIQAKALPRVVSGMDTVVAAETASGKTLCYLLPILRHAGAADGARGNSADGAAIGVAGIVMVPTQELALQVCTVASAIDDRVQPLPVFSAVAPQLNLKTRLVVGTPASLRSWLQAIRGYQATDRRRGNLSAVRVVALDEADMLLSAGEGKTARGRGEGEARRGGGRHACQRRAKGLVGMG